MEIRTVLGILQRVAIMHGAIFLKLQVQVGASVTGLPTLAFEFNHLALRVTVRV